MITIFGFPVINIGPNTPSNMYNWVLTNKNIGKVIKDLLTDSGGQLLSYLTNGHLISNTLSLFPDIGINELYWPTGASRFGCCYLLVQEKVASAIFDLSDVVDLEELGDSDSSEEDDEDSDPEGQKKIKCPSFTCPLFSSYTESCNKKNKQNRSYFSGENAVTAFPLLQNLNNISLPLVRRLKPVIIGFMMNDKVETMLYGGFVKVYMYPLLYIPIGQFEQMPLPDFEGCGILVCVDQRFLWNYMIVKDEYIERDSEKDYFKWYNVVNNVLSDHLHDWQYLQDYASTIYDRVWCDYVNNKSEQDYEMTFTNSIEGSISFFDSFGKSEEEENSSSVSVPSIPGSNNLGGSGGISYNQDNNQNISFEDNNSQWSEYVDSRNREEDNTEESDDDYQCFYDDRDFLGPSFNIKSFGANYSLAQFLSIVEQSLLKRLVFNFNWRISFRNGITARTLWLESILTYVPTVIYQNDKRIAELTVDKSKHNYKELPLFQGGIAIYENRFKYYSNEMIQSIKDKSLHLDPGSSIVLPEKITIYGDEYFTYGDNLRQDIPGGWDNLVPFGGVHYTQDIIDYRSGTLKFPDDLPMVNEYGQFSIPTVKRFISGPKGKLELRLYTTATKRIHIKNGSKRELNKNKIECFCKNVVRNALYWFIVPSTFQFAGYYEWPFSGFEDYITIDTKTGITSVITKSHQLLFPGSSSSGFGIIYGGESSPTEELKIRHALLSNFHKDTPEEPPAKNAIIVGRNKNTDLGTNNKLPHESDVYWHKLLPHEHAENLFAIGNYGVDHGFTGLPDESPDKYIAFIPVSNKEDCTVEWWYSVMKATKYDPSPHLGFYKFDQSLCARGWDDVPNRNPSANQGTISLLNDNTLYDELGFYQPFKCYGFHPTLTKAWINVPIVKDGFGTHKLLDSLFHLYGSGESPTSNEIIVVELVNRPEAFNLPLPVFRKFDMMNSGTALLTAVLDNNTIFSQPLFNTLKFVLDNKFSDLSVKMENLILSLKGDEDNLGPRKFYANKESKGFYDLDEETHSFDDGGGNPDSNPCSVESYYQEYCNETPSLPCNQMALMYKLYAKETEDLHESCDCTLLTSCAIILALDFSDSNSGQCVYKTAHNGSSFLGSPNPCGEENGNYTAEMRVVGNNIVVSVYRGAEYLGQLTYTGDITLGTIPLSGTLLDSNCNTSEWVLQKHRCLSPNSNNYVPCDGCAQQQSRWCLEIEEGDPSYVADNEGENNDCFNAYEMYAVDFQPTSNVLCADANNIEHGVNIHNYCDFSILQCNTATTGKSVVIYRVPETCVWTSRFLYRDQNKNKEYLYGVVYICNCPHYFIAFGSNETFLLALVRGGANKNTALNFNIVAFWFGEHNGAQSFSLELVQVFDEAYSMILPPFVTLTAIKGIKINDNSYDPTSPYKFADLVAEVEVTPTGENGISVFSETIMHYRPSIFPMPVFMTYQISDVFTKGTQAYLSMEYGKKIPCPNDPCPDRGNDPCDPRILIPCETKPEDYDGNPCLPNDTRSSPYRTKDTGFAYFPNIYAKADWIYDVLWTPCELMEYYGADLFNCNSNERGCCVYRRTYLPLLEAESNHEIRGVISYRRGFYNVDDETYRRLTGHSFKDTLFYKVIHEVFDIDLNQSNLKPVVFNHDKVFAISESVYPCYNNNSLTSNQVGEYYLVSNSKKIDVYAETPIGRTIGPDYEGPEGNRQIDFQMTNFDNPFFINQVNCPSGDIDFDNMPAYPSAIVKKCNDGTLKLFMVKYPVYSSDIGGNYNVFPKSDFSFTGSGEELKGIMSCVCSNTFIVADFFAGWNGDRSECISVLDGNNNLNLGWTLSGNSYEVSEKIQIIKSLVSRGHYVDWTPFQYDDLSQMISSLDFITAQDLRGPAVNVVRKMLDIYGRNIRIILTFLRRVFNTAFLPEITDCAFVPENSLPESIDFSGVDVNTLAGLMVSGNCNPFCSKGTSDMNVFCSDPTSEDVVMINAAVRLATYFHIYMPVNRYETYPSFDIVSYGLMSHGSLRVKIHNDWPLREQGGQQ
ncbi:MAG: hypothetical protein QXO37_07070 [Candidatus Nitrosocaldaceae archaeon]